MISGKGLHFDVDGVTIDGVYSVSFRGNSMELDGTDGSSGGFDEPEAGVKSGTFTVRGFYRVGTGAFTGLVNGLTVENIEMFVTASPTDAAVVAPFGVIFDFEVTAEVKGRIDYSATIKTKGAYTISEVAA